MTLTTDSRLPVRLDQSPSIQQLNPVALWRHCRAVQQHLRHVSISFEIEMIDLEAASQVAMAQLSAEMELYVAGMQRAGSDHVMQHLVASKLAVFAATNNIRLAWFHQ